MRLIGRPELLRLARAAGTRVDQAVRSLAAELEAASWTSDQDVRCCFPTSVISGRRLTVDLDGAHCVVVAISYEKGVALVEFAGTVVKLSAVQLGKSGAGS